MREHDEGSTKKNQPQGLVPSRDATVRLSLNVTSYTLLGGPDNPNCFSLAARAGDWEGVRVVNMKLGPFQRVAARGRLRGGVEARLIAPRVAVLTDKRIPAKELHNDRWCTVCTPFALLPEEQQRDYLRTYAPNFHDGKLSSWSATMGVTNDDGSVERFLVALRAAGCAQ